MDLTTLIVTPIVSVVCSSLTGFVTWLLTRKKYNTEVDHNSIENMDSSLTFYERLSDSNNKILAEILTKYEEISKSNLELLSEIQNLKAQIDILVIILQNEVDAVDYEKYGITINEDGTITRT